MEIDDAHIMESLKEAVAGARRILLATHTRPDGDALGSLLGMYFILLGLNKDTVPYCPDRVPRFLTFLPGVDRIQRDIEGRFDASILLDTPEKRLFAEGFDARGTFIVIDHHKESESFGDVVLRQPASAVGELIYLAAKRAGWPVDADAAQCLYTSIVADTSSFKYESATPACHRAAADLIELGAEPWKTATHLFESFSVVRRRLLAEVLGTLITGANDKYASIYCTREMMRSVGAGQDDLEGMVNAARCIAGVELAALLREEEDGIIRVSLRSKGSVDASVVARHFGGGGHVNAAGFRLSGSSMQTASALLLERAEVLLGLGGSCVSK